MTDETAQVPPEDVELLNVRETYARLGEQLRISRSYAEKLYRPLVERLFAYYGPGETVKRCPQRRVDHLAVQLIEKPFADAVEFVQSGGVTITSLEGR